MNKKLFSTRNSYIFILLLAISSCKKERPIPPVSPPETCHKSTITFGHFYGFCGGEGCIEIFKTENNILLEDTADNYPSPTESYKGKFMPLPSSKYTIVADLQKQIPDSLFFVTSHIIGMPDYADGGGIYLEIHTDTNNYFWLIDKSKDNIPTYLHSLVDDISERINKLQ